MTGGRLRIVDVGLDGLDGAVAAALVVGPEVALVDPGPSTSLAALEAGARDMGLHLDEVRHLCLTHVHLDHAGAAGHLAARYPKLTVHLHVDGAPHLADPARLVASTRRTFGDAHDRLWGEVRPIPSHRIRVWRPGERGPLPWLRAIATPGHAGHHVSYLDEVDGTLMAGDALGILFDDEGPVHPATPPPGVDLAAWLETLAELRAVGPERGVWTHFGLHPEPVARARELEATLRALFRRVRAAVAAGSVEADAEAFDAESREAQRPFRGDDVDRYFDAFSAATDHAGMRRFVEKNPGWTAPPEKGAPTGR
ncbi:MAG: MBL fold metallo-hydrolase [Longimicrobiales bacterium]